MAGAAALPALARVLWRPPCALADSVDLALSPGGSPGRGHALARRGVRVPQRIVLPRQATYASRFGRPPPSLPPALVITPTRGLQSPSLPISRSLIEEFASLDWHRPTRAFWIRSSRVRVSFVHRSSQRCAWSCSGASRRAGTSSRWRASSRAGCNYPAEFVGRGDMSRGGLLLRHAEEGRELDYVPLAAGLTRHGAKPPKLPPLPRAATRRG